MRAPGSPARRRNSTPPASLIEKPEDKPIDEDFAKALGIESLGKLRDAVRERIGSEYNSTSRQKLKAPAARQARRDPQVQRPPASLVDQEFERHVASVQAEMANAKRSFADENTTEEKAREDYRKIADRRVRLGLVLSENRREEQPHRDRGRGQPRARRARPRVSRS